jgi:hypothetical protein
MAAARVMIFLEEPGCVSDKITRVLVDHGYSAVPMDPPDQPGHVVLRLKHDDLPSGQVRYALELRGRSAYHVVAMSRYVTPQNPNIDAISRPEVERMVADVVTSPAFGRIASQIGDDFASRFTIERPDLSSCRQQNASR